MPDSLQRNCGLLLHDVARLLKTRFEQRARGGVLGLTRAQWSVLAHLKRNDGINQSSLADRMDIEPITLTRIVEKLEALGYVERRPHPTDRRMRTLHMRPEAGPVLEKMHEVGLTVIEEAFAGLSPAACDRLIETLLLMKRNLSEPGRPGDEAAEHDVKVKHG